jgi:hypothetical protein
MLIGGLVEKTRAVFSDYKRFDVKSEEEKIKTPKQ